MTAAHFKCEHLLVSSRMSRRQRKVNVVELLDVAANNVYSLMKLLEESSINQHYNLRRNKPVVGISANQTDCPGKSLIY